MHQGKLKAAVKKFQPMVGEGKSEAEIREAIAADDKGYSDDEVNEIYSSVATPDTGDDGSDEEETDKPVKAKHTVVMMFRDKNSDKVYRPGDAFNAGSKERLNFLIDKGIIKKG